MSDGVDRLLLAPLRLSPQRFLQHLLVDRYWSVCDGLYSSVTDLINRISSEVWQVLGAVKTEFTKFGDVLDKVKKKLDEASGEIDKTGVRSRAIQRQLREVEAMPANEAAKILGALPVVDDAG